jgi:pyridoxine/pyridoxamine 5'-phosphate oxidase
MRTPYNAALESFLESDLVAREPIAQFTSWFDQICRSPLTKEPNAVALATATRFVSIFFRFFIFYLSIISSCRDGKPSCRMVLLKGFGKSGFRFFSNYESRKGVELVMKKNMSKFIFFIKSHQCHIAKALARCFESNRFWNLFGCSIGWLID